MKKFSYTFFILIAAVILQTSVVWGKQNDVSIFNQKTKSEALVAAKVTKALAKNLSPQFFTVQVQSEIAPVSLEVKKVTVNLQLSQKLSPAYRTQLTKWLNQWVEQTYGVRGSAKVEWISVNVDQTVAPFWLDLIVLTGLLVTALFLLGRAIIKARPPKQLCFAFIEGKISEVVETEVINEDKVYVVPVQQLPLSEWIAETTAEPVSAAETLVIEPIVSVEPFIETEQAEEVIEDVKVVVSPFAFTEQLDSESFKDMFLSLDLAAQVAFFMKAPRATVQRLTSHLDKKLVAKILAETACVQEASDEELTAQMTAWQQAQQSKSPEAVVTTISEKTLRLKEIWLQLPRKDKSLLLEQMGKENPELAAVFLQDQLEVNVLKTWSPEKLRKFCLQVRTRELAAVIKELPFLSEVILSVCPHTMRSEVLREAEMMDTVKTEKNFEAFLVTFDRYTMRVTKVNKSETNLLQIKTKLLQ